MMKKEISHKGQKAIITISFDSEFVIRSKYNNTNCCIYVNGVEGCNYCCSERARTEYISVSVESAEKMFKYYIDKQMESEKPFIEELKKLGFK